MSDFKKLAEHQITVLKRVHDHPERYNQPEVVSAVTTARDFFTTRPEIPEETRARLEQFPWHEAVTNRFTELLTLLSSVSLIHS